jgi:hypothetical protein
MAKYIDYKFDSNGDIVIENSDFIFVEDSEVLKQQLEINVNLVAGDWFLDLTEGIGYFNKEDKLLGNTALTVGKETEIRAAVTKVKGVEQIISFDYDIDRASNNLIISIVALSEFGEIPIETTIGVV